MYQKFNSNTMLTKCIKNILATTYIPYVKVWKPGDPIVNNTLYISDGYIIKSHNEINSENAVISPLDTNYFTVIEPYVRGKFYKGISSNYISNTSIYDSNTHAHLGQYLRTIRDIDGINLMPYYNCWGGAYSDAIRIKTSIESQDGESIIKTRLIQNNNKNDGLKVLLIPIKFDTSYTIYVNNNTPTYLAATYYDGINILNSSMQLLSNEDIIIDRIAKNQPYVLKGVSSKSGMLSNSSNLKEEYLYLFMQLPENDSSSVVVLEGDYSDWKVFANNNLSKTYYGISVDDIDVDSGKYKIDDNIFEQYFKSGIMLNNNAAMQNYAFSDRLVEYLLLNVIDKNDTIDSNIARIQQYASSNNSLIYNGLQLDLSNSHKGVWDRKLRKFCYDVARSVELAPDVAYISPLSFDINGYVDKDSEKIILRGK